MGPNSDKSGQLDSFASDSSSRLDYVRVISTPIIIGACTQHERRRHRATQITHNISDDSSDCMNPIRTTCSAVK